jgi:hypothetical protein
MLEHTWHESGYLLDVLLATSGADAETVSAVLRRRIRVYECDVGTKVNTKSGIGGCIQKFPD